jgi:radical SAM superfamily enzyme YgiQ (UPF0313 family)
VKTHLIIPPSGYVAQRWKEGSTMPPLGILYIAATLEKNGIDVRVTPADILKMKTADILHEVADFDADLIGITITTENRFDTFAQAKAIKRAFPEKRIVVGGPHATLAGMDMMEHIGEIDLAVVGEGEETIVDIVSWMEAGTNDAELSRIRGIIHRDGGRPVFTGPRPVRENLDDLPFPAKHLVPIEKYNFRWNIGGQMIPAANIMSSRGCPFNCNFCSTPITWGRRVRGFSPERVIREIRWNMERFGSGYIWFNDDTFNYSRERTERLCDLIVKEKLDIRFEAEVRIDALTYEQLARMRDAGAHYISFGVEAGSERVRQQIIHKNIATGRIYEVLGWAEKLGVETTVFFIFSHPTETWKEAKETLRIIEEIRGRSEVSVSILHIYPGTELEAYAREKGLLPRDFSWSKRDPRVPTLPAAQGDVPLFKDQFTWGQIGELISSYSVASSKSSLLKKIPQVLKSVRSARDLFRYFLMGLVYLRVKIKKKLRSGTGKDRDQHDRIPV